MQMRPFHFSTYDNDDDSIKVVSDALLFNEFVFGYNPTTHFNAVLIGHFSFLGGCFLEKHYGRFFALLPLLPFV